MANPVGPRVSDEVKVTLTLRKHVAERLKRICYARNMTASHLVDSWVLTANENGAHKAPATGSFLDELFKGR